VTAPTTATKSGARRHVRRATATATAAATASVPRSSCSAIIMPGKRSIAGRSRTASDTTRQNVSCTWFNSMDGYRAPHAEPVSRGIATPTASLNHTSLNAAAPAVLNCSVQRFTQSRSSRMAAAKPFSLSCSSAAQHTRRRVRSGTSPVSPRRSSGATAPSSTAALAADCTHAHTHADACPVRKSAPGHDTTLAVIERSAMQYNDSGSRAASTLRSDACN
jgi:hypothetical protein